MNKLSIILALFAVLLVYPTQADTLVLKSGKSYTGKISISKPGKISIQTKNGRREYDQKVVSMKLLKITSPSGGAQVLDDLEAGKYEEILPILLRWEERYRNLPTPWYEAALYGLGVSYGNLGQRDKAIKYLERLLKEVPQTSFKSKAEFRLIEIQTQGGSSKDIEDKLLAILEDKSTSEELRAKVHSGLGNYYANQKEYLKSLENYVSIVVLYGDIDELQEESQKKCAELFAQIGRTNEAVFYYQQLIKVYPKSPNAEEAKKQLDLLNKKKGE